MNNITAAKSILVTRVPKSVQRSEAMFRTFHKAKRKTADLGHKYSVMHE